MADIELLVADAAALALGTLLTPTWGIYLNGQPVIQPANLLGTVAASVVAPLQQVAQLLGAPNILPVAASTIEFEYGQDFPISNYPQEQGAFQSYNKVTMPFDVKVVLACGGPTSTRQAFLQTCLTIAQSISVFDVVTPERIFSGVNCTHITWPRRSDHGLTLIRVALWFQQIPAVGATSFTGTQQPGDQSAQSQGAVQPTQVSGSIPAGANNLVPAPSVGNFS